MDLFKLVGSIFINNKEANSQIDETNTKAQNLATKIGSAMETAGNKITGLGKAIAPVSAVLATALTTSKSASDFQNGMAKMSTLFDTSKTSVSDLSKEFLTLSNKTGLSASELAEAGYQALSAGQSVDKVGKFVETAGNLAKAGFTSTTTAVDVLTTAMNAYGKSAGSADQIANKLVRTQNLGKTTVDELASAMGKVIPTASSMGVNINNLTSGYVSLTKQGIATAEATTYMNSMFNELGDSGTTLGGVIKEKTGKSFQECMNSGMSLADVLQITKQYADENGISYNELWSSAEAGKAGLAILNGGVDEFNKTVETMASDTDDVGEALEKLETPSVKAHKAINQIKNSGIELGTAFIGALAPTLEKVCGVVEKATTWFSSLDEHTKTMIATAMGIGAVASPVLIIGGKIISGIGSMVGKIGTAISTISSLSGSVGGLSGVLGAITSPIGLVVVAITALIAIFVALYNTNEDFRNTVQSAWATIKETISTVIEAVKELISAFIQLVKQAWDAWGQDIINVVTNAFNYISTFIDSALKIVQAVIQTVTALIKGDWSGVWDGIKNIVSTVWDAIKNLISAGIELVKSIIQLGLNVVKTVFTTVWNAIKGIVQAVWNDLKSVIETVLNAIKSFINTALNAIKSVFSTIWNAIKSVVTTVINAIKSVISSVFNAIKSTITNILNSIKSVFSSVWNGIKSTVSSVINGIKSTISSGMNGAKSTVTGVLNGIKSSFTSIWNGCKSVVSGAINRIKSIMNFSWSLPHLKLPHISISGSFSLTPPSVPHFGISWYKKAMDSPFMFTQPTLFDVNPVTGTAKGAGEAGDEIMYGHSNLMNDIQDAVGHHDNLIVKALNDWFEQLFAIFEEWFPEFKGQLVLDTGALVAETAPAMDEELGKIIRRKERQ
jgi:TP901 family phage tail tape measure protein